jgi:hypothetical protein
VKIQKPNKNIYSQILSMTRKSNRKRNASRRNGRASNANRSILDRVQADARGDVPRSAKRTYVTVSCPRPITSQVYTTRQISDGTEIVASGSARTDTALYFALVGIDNVTNFANLFDQYRIDAVVAHIVPSNNAIQVPTYSSTEFVNLYVVIDYDDANALSSTPSYREYDNCIELAPGESCKRTFQPRVSLSAYSGGAFGAYSNIGGMWLDTASTSIQHYGLKIGAPACDTSQTILQSWKVIIEYYISFRALR